MKLWLTIFTSVVCAGLLLGVIAREYALYSIKETLREMRGPGPSLESLYKMP